MEGVTQTSYPLSVVITLKRPSRVNFDMPEKEIIVACTNLYANIKNANIKKEVLQKHANASILVQ